MHKSLKMKFQPQLKITTKTRRGIPGVQLGRRGMTQCTIKQEEPLAQGPQQHF